MRLTAQDFLQNLAYSLDLKTDAQTRTLESDRFAGSSDSDNEAPAITENYKPLAAELSSYVKGGIVHFEKGKFKSYFRCHFLNDTDFRGHFLKWHSFSSFRSWTGYLHRSSCCILPNPKVGLEILERYSSPQRLPKSESLGPNVIQVAGIQWKYRETIFSCRAPINTTSIKSVGFNNCFAQCQHQVGSGLFLKMQHDGPDCPGRDRHNDPSTTTQWDNQHTINSRAQRIAVQRRITNQRSIKWWWERNVLPFKVLKILAYVPF